jgi:hypothetical protein
MKGTVRREKTNQDVSGHDRVRGILRRRQTRYGNLHVTQAA